MLFPSCLTQLEHQFPPALGLECTTSAILMLRASDSDWNYTTDFSRSPAYRWQHRTYQPP